MGACCDGRSIHKNEKALEITPEQPIALQNKENEDQMADFISKAGEYQKSAENKRQ